MKLEDYKVAMDNLETDKIKYEKLISAIECDEYRFRRKAVTAVVASLSTATVLGVTAAAETGLFTSMQKAFYTENKNIPVATQPYEYAFIPEAESITKDKVTVNFTEAAADKYTIIVFMEIVCEDGLLDKVPEDTRFGFENIGTKYGGVQGLRFNYRNGNTISMYFNSRGITEWENKTTIGFDNFGYYTVGENGFEVFTPLSEISGKIEITDEQIKRIEPKTATSEIDGTPVKMELSPFGFAILSDADTDISNSDKGYIFSGDKFKLYMKNGKIYGDGDSYESVYELLCAKTAGYTEDNYFEYIGFNIPIDTDQIEKITINGCEFVFE